MNIVERKKDGGENTSINFIIKIDHDSGTYIFLFINMKTIFKCKIQLKYWTVWETKYNCKKIDFPHILYNIMYGKIKKNCTRSRQTFIRV